MPTGRVTPCCPLLGALLVGAATLRRPGVQAAPRQGSSLASDGRMARPAGFERVSSEWRVHTCELGRFSAFALSRGCAKPGSWKEGAECGCHYFVHSAVLLQTPTQGLTSKSPGRAGCSLHSFIPQGFVDTCVCHALMLRQWTGHVGLRLLSERH